MVAITGTAKSVPYLEINQCNSFEDHVPVDVIYKYVTAYYESLASQHPQEWPPGDMPYCTNDYICVFVKNR